MQKQNRCLICLNQFDEWQYPPCGVLFGKRNDRPLYTCEECMDDLHRIPCWATSKLYKKYCKKEKALLTRVKGRAVWTTICPTADVTLEEFHKKIIKLTSGTIVIEGWWAYEWRHNISNWNGPDDDLDNNGLHAHIFTRVNNVNSWKTKVKRLNTSNKWSLKAGKVVEMDFPEQDKIDYVKGRTWDNDKNSKKINKDVETRKKYKIKHFFDIGFKPWDVGLQLHYTSTIREEWKGDEPYLAINRERLINNTEEENEL